MQIYTDGSARGNGTEHAVGAWAYAIIKDGLVVEEKTGSEIDSTNQRMELMAAIMALEDTEKRLCNEEVIEIFTDSAYLYNCYLNRWYRNWQANGWRKARTTTPVAHRDLWERLIPFFEKSNIVFHKAKGHSKDTWNDYVDKLAQKLSWEVRDHVYSNN